MTVRTWLPVLVGFMIGLPLSLYYGWVVDPVEYLQTAPGSLREDYRETYLGLIAHAFQSTGEIERAASRLALFEWEDMQAELAALAQRRSAAGGSDRGAQALAALAAQLGATSGFPENTPIPRATSMTDSPFNTPTPTRRPSRTPTAVAPLAFSFELEDRQDVCQEPGEAPQLIVEVLDQDGDPLAGIELMVLWDEGQDRFFTGLKPEISAGYADFTMQSGVRYALQVSRSGLLADDISTHLCRWDNGQYPGSVSLVIVRAEGED